jgi:hypothetical protein
MLGRRQYRPESYFQNPPSIHPCKLDCSIRTADGLDNSFQIDSPGNAKKAMIREIEIASYCEIIQTFAI